MPKPSRSYPHRTSAAASVLKDDPPALRQLVFQGAGYAKRKLGAYQLARTDAFDWLRKAEPQSIHAVVTDPPYGLVEYSELQLQKMKNGHGGIWRIPPSFDGCQRQPLPRFTVLTDQDLSELKRFFERLAKLLLPVLVPGSHVFVATNPLISHCVYIPFIE